MNKRRLSKNQQRRIAHNLEQNVEIDDASEGIIINHYGKQVTVEDSEHHTHRCRLRQNLGDIACGDRVSFYPQTEKEHGVVLAIHPRSNLLQKTGFGGKAKPVAANIDQVVVVCSISPEPNLYLIDRYIVATENLPAKTVIVLNKIDLLDENNQAIKDQIIQTYSKIGIDVVQTSTRTGEGIDDLKALLNNRTSILVGLSGVGKSSIINELIPDCNAAVGEVSAASMEGTHTTTVSSLYHMASGGELIDSPGVRDFTPCISDKEQILRGFTELRKHFGQCKFNDCKHETEPGCAVRDAIENNEMDALRLQSYQHMLRDLEEV